jgi:hypothetical protein
MTEAKRRRGLLENAREALYGMRMNDSLNIGFFTAAAAAGDPDKCFHPSARSLNPDGRRRNLDSGAV